ncbi:MAG: EVE domain-containing protein [Bdellovibrionales bacterium]|nr:EVE domain-containing protein [Bdellovibrionales bacterium]
MTHWLLKTEPSVYSIDQLKKDKKTNWNNIRNFQARNYLRQMKKGDLALIYHSNEDRAVVGLAEIIREAYPDIDPEGGDWVQVDLRYQKSFANPVPLSEIKAHPKLQNLALIKQSRLSTMPVSKPHFDLLCRLGGL